MFRVWWPWMAHAEAVPTHSGDAAHGAPYVSGLRRFRIAPLGCYACSVCEETGGEEMKTRYRVSLQVLIVLACVAALVWLERLP